MTQELFRESGGKIPEDSDLKSSFNWDSNYREHMCRNDINHRISYDIILFAPLDLYLFRDRRNLNNVEELTIIPTKTLLSRAPSSHGQQ